MSPYLTKEKTGLPFRVEKDDHFNKFRAIYDNGMIQDLHISDVISIHLLVELRKKEKKLNSKP